MKDKDVRIGMKVTVQGVEDVCIVVYEKDYKTKNGNVYTLQNEKTGKKMTLNACDFEPFFRRERVQSYTIKIEKNDDGLLSINKKNDGFNPIELLGLLSWAYSDILWQMQGNVKPDIVKREYVEQDEKLKP